MDKISFRLRMACQYTGATAVAFIIAALCQAPPAALLLLLALLVWFAKGIWQHRND